MNENIKSTLEWRATILENSDSLIKSSGKKNVNQLSLFAEVESETISLKVPETVDYDLMLEKEANVLGLALTYSIQDRYILHSQRFCNSNIKTIAELTTDVKQLLFIAKLDKIDYKQSINGNSYGRLFLKDTDSEITAYLFGDNYVKIIPSLFKRRYYLIKASYKAENNSLIVSDAKEINDIQITDYVKTIVIEIREPEAIVKLRNYIFQNMIGSEYSLVFLYNDQEIMAPYKIRFDAEHYSTIKPWINNIEARK